MKLHINKIFTNGYEVKLVNANKIELLSLTDVRRIMFDIDSVWFALTDTQDRYEIRIAIDSNCGVEITKGESIL